MCTAPAVAVVAALALLPVACASGGPGEAGRIDHPSGPGDLVLRMEVSGGLLPPSAALRAIPGFSLYGDGRVVTVGPMIEIYPPPALPPLIVQKLSEDGIQAILAAAGDAGLLGPDRTYDDPRIMDAGTTTFTVNAGGGRHVVSAYALGYGSPPPDEADAGALRRLASFSEKLWDLPSWIPASAIGEESEFAFTQLRIVPLPYEEIPDDVRQAPTDWPLGEPLATFGEPYEGLAQARCGVVAGVDLELLLPAIEASNEITPWRSGDAVYQLVARPLLPDEHGC